MQYRTELGGERGVAFTTGAWRVLAAASSVLVLVSGCVDDDPSRAFDPDDACAQLGGERYVYEPIWTFEPGEREPASPELVFSDDGSLSGRRPAWDQAGDGVVARYALDAEGADAAMARCASHLGGPNSGALNFWGPVSGKRQELGGVVYELPGEGFTFSGGTVTLASGLYSGSVTPPQEGRPYWDRGVLIDASEFDGVSFWARLALPEEAVPIDSDRVIYQPGPESGPAIPQFGESQLGVLVQTIHTGLVETPTATALANPTDPSIAPIEAPPPCDDYNPWLPFCHRMLREGGELPTQCLVAVPIAYCRSRLSRPEPLHPECVQHIPQAACQRPEFADEPVRCAGTLPEDPPNEEPVEDWNELERPFRNQCWDGFRTVKEITHQWRHYFLPFDEMRQAGWGRVAERFETDKIRSLGFMTSAWQPANVLVDEVAFYKRR
jgi:hypothetical protein